MSNLRTIKIRGDSTENWELVNPILEYKEIACEFADSGTFFKIGNGNDSWNDLAYVSVNGGIEEAPIDGKQYARKNAGWEEVVSGGTQIQWGTITGNVTLTDNDSGKTFLITNDAVITVGNGLSAGWNVAFVPDDSKDSTVYDVTLAFSGGGSVIGNTTTVKGVSSLALTPIAGLFAAAGAIE